MPSTSSSNDPLAALDQANGGFSPRPEANDSFSDPFAMPSQSQSVDPLNQQVDWQQPSAPVDMGGSLIPDDWDLDHAPEDTFSTDPSLDPPTEEIDMDAFLAAHHPAEPSEPAPSAATPRPGGSARQRALESASVRIQQEIEALKQQRAQNRQAASSPASVDKTFINALGLGHHELSDEEITRVNQLAGEVMREMVVGLMNVLGSRSAIKSEFRMNVTTIQPVENNPLKFSANLEDALENMFIRQGRAYKQPLDAVADGFQGVAEHQLAIIAGIREAFNSLLARFDPATLEEKFARQNKGGILPGSQKARNWDLFSDYYEELVGDMDRSFQYLFGDGFVRAYEEQLQKLAIKRKAESNDK
jgi:type VI secretion system FHA domain protein